MVFTSQSNCPAIYSPDNTVHLHAVPHMQLKTAANLGHMRLPSYSRWSTKIATWSSTPESICLLETARFTRVQYANGKLCTSRVQKITSCCNGNRTRSLSYCCCIRFVVFCWISGNEDVRPIVEKMSCLHCVRTDVNPELCCEFPKWMSQCQSPWQATGNPQLVGIFRARCNSLLFYSPVQLNLSRAETEKVRTGHNEWLKTKVRTGVFWWLAWESAIVWDLNCVRPEFLTLIGVQLNPAGRTRRRIKVGGKTFFCRGC